MSAPVRLPRLLAALSLTIPLLSVAQTPALTDLERAQRDADKVLSFIKFQTVKTKPAETAEKPPRKPTTAPAPAPAATPRPAAVVRHADSSAAPASAEPAPSNAMPATATTLPTAEPVVPPQAEHPPASFGTPTAAAAPASAASEAESEADAEERDEVALQLQNFVAPVLPPSVQNTLGGSTRKVTVRFTVEANGTVSKAEAATDVPRRFVKPATDAVLQWRFAPLPQPRTVDVEIAFKRESPG